MEIGATKAVQDRLKTTKIEESKSLYNSNDRY